MGVVVEALVTRLETGMQTSRQHPRHCSEVATAVTCPCVSCIVSSHIEAENTLLDDELPAS